MNKKFKLKTPVVLGTKEDGSIHETHEIELREILVSDLKGLSFRSLVADTRSDDWVVLLSRLTIPAIPIASIKMMKVNDFAKLMMGGLEMLGEDNDRS